MIDIENARLGLSLINCSSRRHHLMSAASVSAYLDCSLVEAVDVLKLAVLEGQGKIVASSGGSMVVEKFDDAKAAETKAAINASVKIECDRIKAEARWH